MYCELCLLYYIFCAVLYSVNVARQLFKSSIVCHILCSYIVCITYHAFLNQARASLWPVHAWFLEIDLVCEVCVYVCLCVLPQG